MAGVKAAVVLTNPFRSQRISSGATWESSLKGLLGAAGMVLGPAFAYMLRNSHEQIGVFGVILGWI